MKLLATPIPGVVVVESAPFQDNRGLFYRAFCDQELAEITKGKPVRQINLSRTEVVGAIRGLHFQRYPHAETKLVRCIRGRVWDVAVDLRAGSATFLRWHAEELAPDSARMLVVPEGCAHGFQVLEAGSELLYLHTAPYEPGAEGGVRYDDPVIKIPWPLQATDLSPRDRAHPVLNEDFGGLK